MRRKFRSKAAAQKVANMLGMQITGRAVPTRLKDGTKAKLYTLTKVKKKSKKKR